MRSSGVITDHSAEGRPIGSRSVRAEEQSHRSQVLIEFLLNKSWLHARPKLFLIDLDHLVQVGRIVEDDRMINCLTWQGRSSSTRKYGDVPAIGDFKDRLHVIGMTRDDDPNRFHLIHRSVCGIE